MKEESEFQKITIHDYLIHLKEYFLVLGTGLFGWAYQAPFIIKILKNDYKKYNKNLFSLLWNAFVKYQLLGFSPSEYFEYQLYKNDYKNYVPAIDLINDSKINRMSVDLLISKYKFKKRLIENNISTPKLIAYYNHKEKKIYHYEKPNTETVIIKPNRGGGGRGIKILKYDNYENFVKKMKKDYLVEEYIKQHSFLNKIFDGSVNSIRILTIKKNDDFVILRTILRTGRKTTKGVDNFSKGGLSIDIDLETGILKKGKTHFKHGEDEYEHHPDTGFKFYGEKLPFYDELKKLALTAHKCFPMFNMVGWDIALTEKEPIIIEGNRTPGFFVFQIHEGFKPKLIDTIYYKNEKNLS
jgi:hypothetical protein